MTSLLKDRPAVILYNYGLSVRRPVPVEQTHEPGWWAETRCVIVDWPTRTPHDAEKMLVSVPLANLTPARQDPTAKERMSRA
jgi:hypothetical protein